MSRYCVKAFSGVVNAYDCVCVTLIKACLNQSKLACGIPIGLRPARTSSLSHV